MPQPVLSAAVTRLARAAAPDPAPTDGQLLARFTRTRDAAAFAELVRRLGPMVLGICRRVSGDVHLADDAFQAAFLVLARKPAAVRPADRVRGFLYGVAVRVAREARAVSARRRCREVLVASLPDCPDLPPEPPDADALRILDEEVAALSEHLRAAVILCELDGVSRKDAGRQLGVPEGTVCSRLAKARKVLASRLKRRGIALSVAALATIGRASAVVPPRLASVTSVLAISAGPVPPGVAALSTGVFRAMLLQKLKLPALALAAVGVIASAVLAPASPPPDAPAVAPKFAVIDSPKLSPQPAPKATDAKPLPKGPNKLLVWRNGDLVTLDPDGKNEKTVLGGKDRLYPRMFALSPDGTKVAVVAAPPDEVEKANLGHLYVRELGKDGSGLDLGPAGMAHWSGSATELAICQFTDGNEPSDVKATHQIINIKTKELTRVNLPDNHLMMDWSRDGRYFLTLKIGKDGENPIDSIWVMNRDGSEHKLVTAKKMPVVVFARFSPDGKCVLFMEATVKEETPAEKKARLDAGADGWLVRQMNKLTVAEVATGKLTKVQDIPLNGELQGFCWSPDGKRIAYVWREVHEGDEKGLSEKETYSSLVTCDPDGKNHKTLLSEKGRGQEITLGGVDWR